MQDDLFDVSIRRIRAGKNVPDRPARVTGDTATALRTSPPYTGTHSIPSSHVTMIYIHKCTDPMMWYADMVGKHVELAMEWVDRYDGKLSYWSREPSGMLNLVSCDDAYTETILRTLP